MVFGYKYWAICSHDGYCFKFQLYCGKEVLNEQKLPLGSRVVFSLLDIIPRPNLPDYTVFFDNFFTFTSHNLMATLSRMSTVPVPCEKTESPNALCHRSRLSRSSHAEAMITVLMYQTMYFWSDGMTTVLLPWPLTT